MNNPPVVTQAVQLPTPEYPMVTRMLTRPFFHESQKSQVSCPHCKGQLSIDVKEKEEPIQWVVSEPHPLVPNTRVVRMFVEGGVVEVFSVSTDPKGTSHGMRNLVPMAHVILVEEAMPFPVFIELLTEAEGLEPEPAPGEKPVANGQQSVS